MKTHLGIDYGGTKLLIGEVEEGGRLLNCRRYPTGLTSQKEITEHLLSCLEDYLGEEKDRGQFSTVGIGIVGTSDSKQGIWLSMNHEKGTPIPLSKLVSERLGVPVVVDNDVRSAASAELLWGCGRHCDNFIYVNAGTGLAAGIVADGVLLRGAHHEAGEVGHQAVAGEDGSICVCNRKGCAELYASGLGLHNRGWELRGKIPTDLPQPEQGKRIPADLIFELAQRGDELCTKLAQEAAGTLACLIMNLVRTTDPERVIIGGGLVGSSWFLQNVRDRLEPTTMRFIEEGLTVSQFDGDFAGLIGAAARGAMGNGGTKR